MCLYIRCAPESVLLVEASGSAGERVRAGHAVASLVCCNFFPDAPLSPRDSWLTSFLDPPVKNDVNAAKPFKGPLLVRLPGLGLCATEASLLGLAESLANAPSSLLRLGLTVRLPLPPRVGSTAAFLAPTAGALVPTTVAEWELCSDNPKPVEFRDPRPLPTDGWRSLSPLARARRRAVVLRETVCTRASLACIRSSLTDATDVDAPTAGADCTYVTSGGGGGDMRPMPCGPCMLLSAFSASSPVPTEVSGIGSSVLASGD